MQREMAGRRNAAGNALVRYSGRCKVLYVEDNLFSDDNCGLTFSDGYFSASAASHEKTRGNSDTVVIRLPPSIRTMEQQARRYERKVRFDV